MLPTAAFTTLGCKVNQYETQRILDDFETRGFEIAEFNAPADVYVINTCSVTQAAERKSRYMVRKVTRQNPEAIVVMTGCYGEMAKIKGETVEEASLIVPNHQKLDTLSHLLRAYPDMERALATSPRPASARSRVRRHRATLKVQDGCDVFCSFCSIPYTRSVMTSRPVAELVAEAERRAAEGYREIVVTGVLVGAYGQERLSGADAHAWSTDRHYTRPDLADLLLTLARVRGIERVRLSSIEPTQVTRRLLEAFEREPGLCRHLHIPLQSGDTGILQAMNRPYTCEDYLARCSEASACLPDLAITSDIMVGFPGEDRAAFENTLRVVHQVGFARAHLFRYSPRPNTPAAAYTHQVSEEEKEARSHELNAACRETQMTFIRRHLHREMDVLVEGKEPSGRVDAVTEEGVSGNDGHPLLSPGGDRSGGLLSGYTSNYIRVQFTGGSDQIGKIVRVHLTEPTADGALGEAGGAHFDPNEAPSDADFIPLATLGGTSMFDTGRPA